MSRTSPVHRRQRIGGMLNYHYRAAWYKGPRWSCRTLQVLTTASLTKPAGLFEISRPGKRDLHVTGGKMIRVHFRRIKMPPTL